MSECKHETGSWREGITWCSKCGALRAHYWDGDECVYGQWRVPLSKPLTPELDAAIEKLTSASRAELTDHGRLVELINQLAIAYLGKEEYARRLQEAML